MRLPNLLPEQNKKAYRRYLIGRYIRRFLYIQIGAMLVFSLILAGEFVFYRKKSKDLQAELNNLRLSQGELNVAELQKTADEHNIRLQASQGIIDAKPAILSVLDEVMRSMPEGATLDSVKIDTLLGRVEIKGRASDREKVVALQSYFEKSNILTPIFKPLSNLTSSLAPSFSFILTFKTK